MMHLASNRHEIERPSVFELGCRLLGDDLRLERHAYFLRTGDHWEHADVDAIMRRVNERRKAMGHPQFTNKSEWVVT